MLSGVCDSRSNPKGLSGKKPDEIRFFIMKIKTFTPLLVCSLAKCGSVPTTVIKRVAVISAMPSIITEYPQFFTATNLEWKSLLQSDKYKDIVVDSLRFIVNNKKVIIYG
jgi:hypothetical protein